LIQVRFAALLAALTLVLVGCSDDDPEPNVDPTPSTSPSDTEEPAPTTSTSPASLTPVQAVRGWVHERNRSLTSGDTTALRGLTADECASCEPYIDLIDDVYAAGGSYETKGWTVDNAKELKDMEVTAAITMGAGVMIAAAGTAPDKYEEDKAIFRFRVTPSEGELVVSYIGLIR
jgi:hypothetical protein